MKQYSMKQYVLSILALGLMFLTPSFAAAQFGDTAPFSKKTSEKIVETIAPLISDATILVGHLDLNRIDLDQLIETLVRLAERDCKRSGHDGQATERIVAECRKTLEQLKPMAEEFLESIADRTGIDELYLVVNFAEVPFLLATPVGEKDEEQKSAISELLRTMGEGELSLAEVGELMIAFPTQFEDGIVDFLENLEPGDATQFEVALADRENDLLKFAARIPDQVLAMLGFLDQMGESDMPKEVVNVLKFFGSKTEWAALGIDPYEPAAQLTIKTPKARDAKQLRSMLEGLIDWGALFAQAGLALNEDEDFAPYRDFMPLFVELGKGCFRAILPRQEDDRLIFRVDTEHSVQVAATSGAAIALLLPAVQASREAARRMQCANNMKQIGLAFHNYHDVQNKLPPAYSVDEDGKPLHSWRVLILPYIERQELYEAIRLDEPWDSEHNKQYHDACSPIFRCPSKSSQSGQCDYSIIVGKETAFDGKSNTFATVTDGLSNTVYLVERREPVCWMDPTQEISFDDACKGILSGRKQGDAVIGSNHTGGCQVGLLDGSIRFVSETIDLRVWKALLTCRGGESAGL